MPLYLRTRRSLKRVLSLLVLLDVPCQASFFLGEVPLVDLIDLEVVENCDAEGLYVLLLLTWPANSRRSSAIIIEGAGASAEADISATRSL